MILIRTEVAITRAFTIGTDDDLDDLLHGNGLLYACLQLRFPLLTEIQI
jgi:hypothetical protein